MTDETTRVAGVVAPPVEDERAASVAATDGPDAGAATAKARRAADAAVPRQRDRGATGADGRANRNSNGVESAGAREHVLSVAAHPRAARRVAESKAWGGVAGFVAGGYLSLANHTLAEAAVRALVTGVVCYVAVWAAAVLVWRRLVVAELRDREHALLSGALARREAAAAGATAGGESEQPGAAER